MLLLCKRVIYFPLLRWCTRTALTRPDYSIQCKLTHRLLICKPSQYTSRKKNKLHANVTCQQSTAPGKLKYLNNAMTNDLSVMRIRLVDRNTYLGFFQWTALWTQRWNFDQSGSSAVRLAQNSGPNPASPRLDVHVQISELRWFKKQQQL